MAEYASLVSFLNCSWNAAVRAFWIKYPNPYSKHVLTEDVLERKLTLNGQLYTRRLLTKTNKLPRWGKTIFHHENKRVCILEESLVDPYSEKMTVYSWNTNYTSMMDVQERVTISANKPENTKVLREGWVNSSLTGLRHILIKFGISRWKENTKKAHLGFQGILSEHIKNSGNSAVESKFNSLINVKDKAKLKAVKIAAKSKMYT